MCTAQPRGHGILQSHRLSILVIGFGAREHALLWKVAQSPHAGQLFAAPGNAGTSDIATNVPIDVNDVDRLLAFARERRIDLTVVGPTPPLAAGIVDRFRAAGLRIFGPTAAAARLESSKTFAKSLMHRLHIPTPLFASFTALDRAVEHVRRNDLDEFVVKIDGLGQSGRGVSVCDSKDEAVTALRGYFGGGQRRADGAPVLVEQRLYGPEVSFFAITDGRTVAPLMPVRDYKRMLDGDRGPNTGGMGAIGPVSAPGGEFPTQEVTALLQRTIDAMAEDGHPVVGIVYAGVMFTTFGPQLLEFNLRFGNPEALVLLPLLDGDLVELLDACIEGQLGGIDLRLHSGAAATIVAATDGCRDGFVPRRVIAGADNIQPPNSAPGTLLFHHGTIRIDGAIVSTRERVIASCSVGESMPVAVSRAYDAIAHVRFPGMQLRRDIGSDAFSESVPKAVFPASVPG